MNKLKNTLTGANDSLRSRFQSILHMRIARFAVVGGLGVIVNLAVYMILSGPLHITDFVSRAIAIEVSVLHNFLWSIMWVWHDRTNEKVLLRLTKYHSSTLVSSFGITLVVGWLVLQMLEPSRHAAIMSHIFGTAAGMFGNFLMAEHWVFAGGKNIPGMK